MMMNNLMFRIGLLLLFSTLVFLSCREEEEPEEDLPRWEDESWCLSQGYGFNGQTCYVPEGYVLRWGDVVPLDPNEREYIVEIEEGCLCKAIFLSAKFGTNGGIMKFEGVYENEADDELYQRFEDVIVSINDWSLGSWSGINHVKYWEPGYRASFIADSINLYQFYSQFDPCFFQGIDHARDTSLEFYHETWAIEIPLPIEDYTDFPGALRFFRDAPSGDSLIFEECMLRFYQ